MQSADLPALYQSADNGSNAAQRSFLWLVRAEFIFLLLVAVLNISALGIPNTRIIQSGLLGLLLILLVLRYSLKLDEQWYKCRALAESIKTTSWRFSMRAHPYGNADSVKAPTRSFLETLVRIKRDNEHIGSALDSNSGGKDQISQKMFEVRQQNLEERLEYYLEHRIRNQRNWYTNKARYNMKRRRLWFGIGIVGYILCLALLFSPELFQANLSSASDVVLVVVVSSFAWLQLKRHGELAASYLLTAHEIGIVEQKWIDVVDEDTMSDFVNEAEFAFSREHTQWVARKDAI